MTTPNILALNSVITYFDFCEPSVDSKYSFTDSVKIIEIKTC